MYDVITIGSALVDIFIRSKQFVLRPTSKGTMICQAYGDKIDVEGFELHTGGGGSNTGVGFARVGFTVATVTETGKDSLSELLFSEFHKERVSTNHIVQEKKEETGGSVALIGEDGGRTIMVHRGASSMLDPHDIPMRAVKSAGWIHLSSIGGRLLTLKKIGSAIKEGKARCSWNPGLAEIELLVSGKLDIKDLPCAVLIVNLTEWKLLRTIQRQLKQAVPEIIVTDGKEGCKLYLTKKARPISYPSGGADAVDATGAGDAFAVGYVSARIHNKRPQDAVPWGVRNATSVVGHLGAKAGLLTQKQLAKDDPPKKYLNYTKAK